MKAVCWQGTKDITVEDVPDPKILNPRDAIVKITSTAICGSDLHLYNNLFPGMRRGDILGHEYMGEVVEVGSGVKNLKAGDRVIVPFVIACGGCFFCKKQLFSACDNSNPNAAESELMLGYPGSGMFGYTHLTGGYAGGQAEMARVPFADVGPLKIPNGIADEKVLFLTDIFPTGWMAAENCEIKPDDTIAVWGCGPVGLMAIMSAVAMGAARVYAIDNVPGRLELARQAGGIPINCDEQEPYDVLYDATGGRGPDACIDAVGMEAHGHGVVAAMDKIKQKLRIENDIPTVLREMIRCCRKAGILSIPGVYSGFVDKIPFGIAFSKGLQFRMGQTHVQKYHKQLLQLIVDGKVDPSIIISHRLALEDAPNAYKEFNERNGEWTKVVLKPGATSSLKSGRTATAVTA